MSDADYFVALSTFTDLGPVRLKLLLDYFGNPKKIWQADGNKLLSTGLSAKIVKKFTNHRKKLNIEDYLRKLQINGVVALTKFDIDYPENLRDLTDSPYVLYVRGNLRKSDRLSVAIVGTRSMTFYGKTVAEKFALDLVRLGITVISGLALGIDAVSQKAAVDAGGRTISVLGSGLDIITPVTNSYIAQSFLKKSQGALVSEYPLGYTPHPYDFPVRDRIIAGMSKAVIVVEGKLKSGTFHTVKYAAEYGRPVFAVPGPITSPASEGPNYLISTGARPILAVNDILDELGISAQSLKAVSESAMQMAEKEKVIYDLLKTEPRHLDELVRISGVSTDEISARLTVMELKGFVRNLGGGSYARI